MIIIFVKTVAYNWFFEKIKQDIRYPLRNINYYYSLFNLRLKLFSLLLYILFNIFCHLENFRYGKKFLFGFCCLV